MVMPYTVLPYHWTAPTIATESMMDARGALAEPAEGQGQGEGSRATGRYEGRTLQHSAVGTRALRARCTRHEAPANMCREAHVAVAHTSHGIGVCILDQHVDPTVRELTNTEL